MKSFFNTISASIMSLGPLVGATIIGIAIYEALPNTLGIGILILLGIAALYTGLQIFKRVQIVGPIEFLAKSHGSPDLDHLEPTANDATKRRTAVILAERLTAKQSLQEGRLRIFGDWFQKSYHHPISAAHFDTLSNTLSLHFKQGQRLDIQNPKHIFEAPTFIKIIRADSITLTWQEVDSTSNRSKVIDYQYRNGSIHTTTNCKDHSPNFDVALNAPALMIYG